MNQWRLFSISLDNDLVSIWHQTIIWINDVPADRLMNASTSQKVYSQTKYSERAKVTGLWHVHEYISHQVRLKELRPVLVGFVVTMQEGVCKRKKHREITPRGLSRPCFHASLHIFPPPPGPAGSPSRTTGGGGCSLGALNVTLLILVLEIPFNF